MPKSTMDRPIINKIIKKIINAKPGTYVIFFVYECRYCERALNLLRRENVLYKGYNIDEITGGMPKLLSVLNENAKLIGFDPTHQTKPIIFLNGKFLGGANELVAHFD